MNQHDENRLWDTWASPTPAQIDREIRAWHRFVLTVLALVFLVVGTVAYWTAPAGLVLL